MIAALYSFFPVRVMDMHFLLIFSWLVYLVATLAIDRDDVSDHWRYPKQVTRIVALLGLGGIVAVDTHLRDFSMATKYILKRRYEAKKSKLEKDELRAKELLHNMLPPQVLRALEDGEPVEAECYASVTVLFVQLCDFEVMSRGLQPVDLVKILNVIFSRFDDIVKRHSVCVLASSSRPLLPSLARASAPTRNFGRAHTVPSVLKCAGCTHGRAYRARCTATPWRRPPSGGVRAPRWPVGQPRGRQPVCRGSRRAQRTKLSSMKQQGYFSETV